jgi:hypothetical protein
MDSYFDSQTICGLNETHTHDAPGTGQSGEIAEGTSCIRVDWRLALAYFTVGVVALLLI